MNNNRGFTLIELIISTVVILIVSLGFCAWAATMIHRNVAAGRNNTAYDMALDIANRLSMMPDTALIQYDSGGVNKEVGFDTSGVLSKCDAGFPTESINIVDATGLTEYTNPFDGVSLYLYDKNLCTTANPVCLSDSVITDGANANIDHPNDVTTPAYDNINPVRFINNTTFYAVWSITHLPCGTGTDTDRRKIFVTVYWIDPEPGDATPGAVVAAMAANTYELKSISIVIDKAIGV